MKLMKRAAWPLQRALFYLFRWAGPGLAWASGVVVATQLVRWQATVLECVATALLVAVAGAEVRRLWTRAQEWAADAISLAPTEVRRKAAAASAASKEGAPKGDLVWVMRDALKEAKAIAAAPGSGEAELNAVVAEFQHFLGLPLYAGLKQTQVAQQLELAYAARWLAAYSPSYHGPHFTPAEPGNLATWVIAGPRQITVQFAHGTGLFRAVDSGEPANAYEAASPSAALEQAVAAADEKESS